MQTVKKLLQSLINIFFKIFFSFHKPSKISPELQKAIDLYEDGGFNELFSKIRVWDAPFTDLEKVVPKSGTIVDLGSGDGLLGNYLAICSLKRNIFGMEMNNDRVKISDKQIKNTKFTYGDILKNKYPPNADCYILAHVLHHLPSRKDQERLLDKLSKNLKKNKKLLILEIGDKPILKYWFTWFIDAFIVPILFEGRLFNFSFYYRKPKEWKKLLEDKGFKVKIFQTHQGMPFSHILIEATKE